MPTKKIVWEHLYEPLPDIEDDNDDGGDTDEDDDEDYSSTHDRGPGLLVLGPNMPQIVPTPLGPSQLNDPLNPRRVYDFQVGHTNFALTTRDIEKIKNVAGVEIVLFTKYRFIIGCGRLFDIQAVKLAIQSELYGFSDVYDTIDSVHNEEIREQISKTIEEISKNNRFWAMYVFPNGKISTVLSNDDDFNNGEWLRKLAALREAKQQSGGLLFVCKHS